MSGGSYNHTYYRITELAERIRCSTTLRRAFCQHLFLVATACKSIEWNDSGDGDDAEDANIRACINTNEEIAAAIITAQEALTALEQAIERAKSTNQ